jgi:integrase
MIIYTKSEMIMAKVKLVLDVRKSYARTDGTSPIKISVHHANKTRYCSLDVFAREVNWDKHDSLLRRGHPDHLDANVRLETSLQVAKDTLVKYKDVLESLTSDQLRDFIVEELQLLNPMPRGAVSPLSKKETEVIVANGTKSVEFFAGATNYIEYARRIKFKSLKTLSGWSDALGMFCKFWELAHPDQEVKKLQLLELRHRDIDEFIAWHCSKINRSTGDFNKYSGVNVYCKGLRSMIKSMIIFHELDRHENNPFSEYTLKDPKYADPEKITLVDIRAILGVKFDRGSRKWDQVNFATVMFNGEGMNFKDLSKLRMKNVADDEVKYIRSKNKQPMNFVIKGKSVEIFEHYMSGKEKGGNAFIFPIIKENSFGTETEQYLYRKSLNYFNATMTRVAKERLGPNRTVTTYFFRKGTVQALAEVGGSFDDAQSMLRHKNPKVTLRYWSPVARERIESLTDKTAF